MARKAKDTPPTTTAPPTPPTQNLRPSLVRDGDRVGQNKNTRKIERARQLLAARNELLRQWQRERPEEKNLRAEASREVTRPLFPGWRDRDKDAHRKAWQTLAKKK
jgi:hypothetical protein